LRLKGPKPNLKHNLSKATRIVRKGKVVNDVTPFNLDGYNAGLDLEPPDITNT